MSHPSVLFGTELRRRRLTAGLSLRALASAVHYSTAQLSKVERGLKAPSRDLVRLCDAALRAGGELLALVPGASGAAAEPERRERGEEEWEMRLTDEGGGFRTVGRRQAVVAGAASLMAWRAPAAEALPPGTGEELLAASRTLFTQYRHLGQSMPPGMLLPALVAQTHTLRGVAALSRTGVRERLFTLGSRYAEYIGWLFQEDGDERAALWWTREAVDLAAAGGDRALAGYALVRRALVTLYREDAAETVALARRAQHAALPPRVRGLAAQREAQGHALAGDGDSCMRALDRARELLARDEDSGQPVLGSSHLPDPAGMVTGWCLVDLGRPGDGAEELGGHLARIAPGAVRTHVRYGVRQALARAFEGEIDEACALTARLLDNAAALHSATVRVDLRRLARALARHRNHPGVRELAPRLGPMTALRLS
ncbi:helix-turn-helix domain-containing protein [Streptomyces sp. NRRL F-5630]|uniref:helix-turn-helix domain-containing protein n=1 Tax=Streptomyces sp. NRRL F-5630 TaxID=1463864 RepID=UPI003D70E63B